jgi:hypothetical protein
MDLDTDELIALARSDPQAFEQRRLQLIEEIISAAPEAHRARLRGLQFRIDLERQRSATSLGACIRLNTMMWDSFVLLRESVTRLVNHGVEASVPAPARDQKATVIPFSSAMQKAPPES